MMDAVKIRMALARELMLINETLRMQVVRGALPPAAASRELERRAKMMLDQRVTRTGLDAILKDHQAEATRYFAFIANQISAPTGHWPPKLSAAEWRNLATGRLNEGRNEHAKAMKDGQDASLALGNAYTVLAWSRGQFGRVTTPFDTPRSDVGRYLPKVAGTPEIPIVKTPELNRHY